jgi:hypothetical protein
MWSHFATNEFLALWEKIKTWVKTDDLAKFSQLWGEISSDPLVPQSLVQYLATDWLHMTDLWSRTAQKDQSIFEEGDTNMLIEAYVPLKLIDKITDFNIDTITS